MAVVYFNTVHSENASDFLDYVSAACFDTVSVLQLVRVVRLDAAQVENVRVALKFLEIDALYEEVRFIGRLCSRNQAALLNACDVSNYDTLHHALNDSHHQDFLPFNRESQCY